MVRRAYGEESVKRSGVKRRERETGDMESDRFLGGTVVRKGALWPLHLMSQNKRPWRFPNKLDFVGDKRDYS
jgi:hypothetical protein